VPRDLVELRSGGFAGYGVPKEALLAKYYERYALRQWRRSQLLISLLDNKAVWPPIEKRQGRGRPRKVPGRGTTLQILKERRKNGKISYERIAKRVQEAGFSDCSWRQVKWVVENLETEN
jgi:hypothetical protein